jgi:glyoxylase-like metal-dependent hydrolase (beta-lactamase superfamily II)
MKSALTRPSRDEIRQLQVDAEWFALDDLSDGITRITEPHVHELLRANAYLVKGQVKDLLIDAGLGIASLRSRLERERLLDKPVLAVATHAHCDHVGSLHEFADIVIHESEARWLAEAADEGTLYSADFDEPFRRMCAEIGIELPPLLIDALPSPEYNPAAYRVVGVQPTGVLREGDVVELGDRSFEVLHLPGHSPGCIGLYDRERQTLFPGDAIYDGVLLDEALPGADIAVYVATMRRLIELPVSVVHPGHEQSFDRARMIEIARDYLARRDTKGMRDR